MCAQNVIHSTSSMTLDTCGNTIDNEACINCILFVRGAAAHLLKLKSVALSYNIRLDRRISAPSHRYQVRPNSVGLSPVRLDNGMKASKRVVRTNIVVEGD